MTEGHQQHLQAIWSKLVFFNDFKAAKRHKGIVPSNRNRSAHDDNTSDTTRFPKAGNTIFRKSTWPQVIVQQHDKRVHMLNGLNCIIDSRAKDRPSPD